MAKLNGSLWGQRSYNVVEYDPAIDELRKRFEKLAALKNTSQLAVIAGLHSATVSKMFGGETRRPQHATLAKTAYALGCEYELRQTHKFDYDTELVKAREEFKEHKLALAKSRAKKRNKRTTIV